MAGRTRNFAEGDCFPAYFDPSPKSPKSRGWGVRRKRSSVLRERARARPWSLAQRAAASSVSLLQLPCRCRLRRERRCFCFTARSTHAVCAWCVAAATYLLHYLVLAPRPLPPPGISLLYEIAVGASPLLRCFS